MLIVRVAKLAALLEPSFGVTDVSLASVTFVTVSSMTEVKVSLLLPEIW